MQILVVYDSKDIAGLLSQVLSTVGHQVTTVNNGKDSIELLMAQKYDIVFLDIAMPDFSGLDVISTLIEKQRIHSSPIVLFTATPITDAQVDELIQKGVHSIIRKPVRLEALFAKIEEIAKTS
ncbi:MAG: response regulator [Candidatus Nitrosotenuis sp.]